jgi:4-diphosphocytidyl-2-C-methyl-D-erythritol kinase
MRVLSFAKVNLWLRVVGKRDDGFHELETFFHTVSLHDEIDIDPEHPELEVAMTPSVENNLALAAARLLHPDRGARIEIRKNIPIGAGLAGGSGNAAAVLVALHRAWGLDLDLEGLLEIAAELGSDVPFMVVGGTALGRGRGELLERIQDAPRLWFVLGISNQGSSTADVYARWRPEHRGIGTDLETFRDILIAGDPDDIAAAVRNDLQPAALELRPELAARIDSMRAAGALTAFISGSGPTVVGLARSSDQAGSIAAQLGEEFDRVEVVRSHPPGG